MRHLLAHLVARLAVLLPGELRVPVVVEAAEQTVHKVINVGVVGVEREPGEHAEHRLDQRPQLRAIDGAVVVEVADVEAEPEPLIARAACHGEVPLQELLEADPAAAVHIHGSEHEARQAALVGSRSCAERAERLGKLRQVERAVVHRVDAVEELAGLRLHRRDILRAKLVRQRRAVRLREHARRRRPHAAAATPWRAAVEQLVGRLRHQALPRRVHRLQTAEGCSVSRKLQGAL